MKTDQFFIGCIVGIVVGGMVAAVFTKPSVENGLKRQAISAGVARYEVNPTTGNVSFVWITNHANQVTK